MKDNLRRMNWLIKIFGIDSFYHVEFDNKRIAAFVAINSEVFDLEKAYKLFGLPHTDNWGVKSLLRKKDGAYYKIILNQ